jgi:hypothetical protein
MEVAYRIQLAVKLAPVHLALALVVELNLVVMHQLQKVLAENKSKDVKRFANY